MPPSTDALLRELLDGIDRELPLAVELRHRLHANPELAHEELATVAAVATQLPVRGERAAGTGLIAHIGPERGSAVAVRAELDGLAVPERTGAPFAARGASMHACGHDVHMAALVAFARSAHRLSEHLPAPLLVVLQPSEEAYPSGAQALAEGELGRLRPASIVAAHIHPQLPWGTVGLDSGPVNASCDAFEIAVTGQPSHGAYPHLGRDPILALAEIVVSLHAQLGRRIDPLGAASLTVGVIDGGSAENVIPAGARARGAVRAHSAEDRRTLRALVEEVAAGVAAAHGCVARVELTAGEPPLENDPEIVATARGLLEGAGMRAAPAWRSCGSDDFAFLGALAPLTMAFVGLEGASGFRPRPLHHPELLPPDEAVAAVARVQAILYLAGAGRKGARLPTASA